MSPSLATLSSLKRPGFRFYLGMYLSQMAVHDIRIVANSLLIYRLTGSVALLGVLSLVSAVPGILLPLIGGVIADRVPKKYILNIGQAAAVVPSLVVALSLSLGVLSTEITGSWWILIAAALLSTVASSLTTPASLAIISEVVGKDHVMNAVSLRSTGYNLFHLGVPALAGLAIDGFGFASVFYIMGVLSFIGLIFSLFLPKTDVQIGEKRNAIRQLKDGFGYARNQTHILFILIFTMVTAILIMPYSRLLPVYVDDILQVGATGYGVLLSASAIGAIVGSLVMASLPNKRRGVMLLVDVALLGLALMAFAFSSNWFYTLVIIAVVGLLQPARYSLSNSLVQSNTDQAFRGRMMSFYSLQDGILSLGGFLAAMVAGLIGTPWTVFSFALIMSLLALLSLVFLPRVRRLD